MSSLALAKAKELGTKLRDKASILRSKASVLGSQAQARAKEIMGLPQFNIYLAGFNIVVSLIALTVYSSSIGPYMNSRDTLLRLAGILIVSMGIYALGPLLPFTNLKFLLIALQSVILFYIGYWLVNGPSDRKAADNQAITDSLITKDDGSRCLPGTGTPKK